MGHRGFVANRISLIATQSAKEVTPLSHELLFCETETTCSNAFFRAEDAE